MHNFSVETEPESFLSLSRTWHKVIDLTDIVYSESFCGCHCELPLLLKGILKSHCIAKSLASVHVTNAASGAGGEGGHHGNKIKSLRTSVKENEWHSNVFLHTGWL